MTVVKWDESLALGVDLIDEQHKEWLGRLANVSAAISAHKGPEEVARTLDFLTDYTDHHFSTEEKYMTEYGYDGFEAHREKHEELRQTLSNLVEEFEEDGATVGLAEAVDTFLGNWLSNHIRQVDQYFAAFLSEEGIVLSE